MSVAPGRSQASSHRGTQCEGTPVSLNRRHFMAGAVLPLLGCEKPEEIAGGFTGIEHARGHLLRGGKSWPAPTRTHTTQVVIAGGGVAGLAAARALRLRGVDDFALLELEDSAGGNSRGATVGGIACPLGAHYLPVPGDNATEVQDLLEELGLRRRVAGRWVYDERHLCHSPQERLFFNGAWQDGLLPLQGVDADTLAQYHRFAALVEQARRAEPWRIPVFSAASGPLQKTLKATTFTTWLDRNGLSDKHLRWYLNYCCLDDYGAGASTVSAWAGMHYFASRHGFEVPGQDSAEHEGVLTWPEGNSWLTRRMATPLGERLHTGQVVVRIASVKQGVEVDAFNPATQSTERWRAQRCIVALPVFVAARVVENPPSPLVHAAARTRYAPWLVANIHIKAPLHDRPGAAPSWDNVLYADEHQAQTSGGLGYVDATHQSLQSVPGATVLSHYRALGDVPDGRRMLLNAPWSHWRDLALADLGRAHPDLRAKTTRVDITRYGHAMAIPVPRDGDLQAFVPPQNAGRKLSMAEQAVFCAGPLAFAHGDWAGYSVFEEAFTLGHAAGNLAGNSA